MSEKLLWCELVRLLKCEKWMIVGLIFFVVLCIVFIVLFVKVLKGEKKFCYMLENKLKEWILVFFGKCVCSVDVW